MPSPIKVLVFLCMVVSSEELGFARHETETFTDREREAIEHLAKGYLYKEISDVVEIGVETVCRHLSNIYGKLTSTLALKPW